jgi:dCTP deaminase
MSILLKGEIEEHFKNGTIHVEPFNEQHIGPNSYDVTLGGKLIVYDFSQMQYLDSHAENPIKEIIIPETGFVLQPGILYLGNTVESVGSSHFIPMYEGRSSMARLGIQSHLSAGFGDIGFKRQWTLEISVVHPVKVYAGMRIGQVYFHRVHQQFVKDDMLYHGKYTNQSGPQPSLSYQDFELIEHNK